MSETSTRRDVVVLGSTGSVGTQAIELARRNPDRFRVVGIGAGGSDVGALAAQAIELGVDVVAVARGTAAPDLQLALYADAQRRGYAHGEVRLPRILAGPVAMTELAAGPSDVVLNAITGSVGLAPTIAALDAGRLLALANKESLVVGGRLVTDRAKPGQIVPVDSEHSALAQCLRGERPEDVRKLVLTASGGPFRGRTTDDLRSVTYAEARAHPTWDMGPVITINSATLMNKGLEVIEAHLLFGIPYAAIEVVVHPQSVVHSMVEFVDGSTLAQASPPDMTLPIALALGWPERVPGAARACDWSTPGEWTFEPLDGTTFPAVELCRGAGRLGGTAPAVVNAANEESVAAFEAGRLSFLGIVDTVARVLHAHLREPGRDTPWNTPTLADVLAAEQWARERARALVDRPRGETSA